MWLTRIIVIIVFFIPILFSCKTSIKETDINWEEIYKDSVFLNIEGGDLEQLFIEAKVNHAVYYQAVKRMEKGLSVKDDTLYLKIRNGAEIKISENIYDYVSFMIRLENRKRKNEQSE